MASPKYMNPCPIGHEIYSLSRLVIGHHFKILSLSDLCLRLKKRILETNYAFSIYDLYGHAYHKNPCPGVMKFTIYVDTSL